MANIKSSIDDANLNKQYPKIHKKFKYGDRKENLGLGQSVQICSCGPERRGVRNRDPQQQTVPGRAVGDHQGDAQRRFGF